MNRVEAVKNNLSPPMTMTPYKMSVMLKTAGKIMNTMANIPDWLVSWDEMEMILEMTLDSIRRCRNEKAPTD